VQFVYGFLCLIDKKIPGTAAGHFNRSPQILFFTHVVQCESIDLVLWGEPGTIGSIVGHKFTTADRAHWVIANVPPNILGILVGLILSDGGLSLRKGYVKARLFFDQSSGINNSSYFWYVYFLLGPIAPRRPYFPSRFFRFPKTFYFVWFR